MKLFSSSKMLVLALSLLTSFSSFFPSVKADFGDYVDPTFNCPATTTCPQVCVANMTDCPSEMLCDNGEMLCLDGSCAVSCDDGSLESPCEFECAPVACRKVVALYDACFVLYGSLYDAETACGEEETAATTTLLQFNEPAYVAVYIWVSVFTFLIIAWCAYNQRIAPIEGSSKSLQVDARVTGNDTGVVCSQTGYKIHFVGTVMFVLTLMTFFGWSVLLLWLTIQYYATDGNPFVSKRKVVFDDEEQLLKTFIIVWNMGFIWCFALKYPINIRSIFLRRCVLSEATHIAVYLAQDNTKSSKKFQAAVLDSSWWALTKDAFERAFNGLNTFMSFVFSDDGKHRSESGIFQYCPVKKEKDGTRSFIFLFRRYNFEDSSGIFKPGSWTVGGKLSELAAAGGNNPTGLSAKEVQARYRVVGRNVIEMEKPFFPRVLLTEFTKPFYTYQLFMVWSWFPLYYYYMALVLAFVVTSGAITVAWFHYRNLRNLYGITHIFGEAQVLREGKLTTVPQTALVPGDVVKLMPGMVYSDMVLLSGDDALVDESALTGEATPQIKAPIDPSDNGIYDSKVHKRHTISAGTSILETEDSMALVMQTASYTAKGELLREIFSFRRHQFKFDSEIAIVIGILFLYAIFGFNMVIYFIEDTTVYGWFYGIYVVGTILPPLLPTVFTVSVGVSDNRLANKRIACANSESILIAGKVTRAFFDKTGTLTKPGLDFLSARSAKDWESTTISEDLSMAMACCHALTRSSSGVIVGNPVDSAMFAAAGASFSAGSITWKEQTITNVRHFDFDHHRMSQGVIAKIENNKYIAFVKGSGESIAKICTPSSLPDDFHASLQENAAQGIYQISVSMKPISAEMVNSITRDDIEKDLEFIGVINFLNAIREDTPNVIRQLTEGSVQSVMVTGDSVLTGIRVAKESGVISADTDVIIGNVDNSSGSLVWKHEENGDSEMPSFAQLDSGSVEMALSGKAWETLLIDDPKLASQIAPYVRVFGRCTPRDKVSVVDTFVELGFITMMTGDGGNDCGALKAAHVGIALSDAEASIVAPFTSLDRTISSVLDVLKEGRCALASALATYKYIIMYGQVETINQIINAYFQVTFTEWCWVFMDGIWVLGMSFTLPLAQAADKLAKTRPTASLLGPHTLSSTLGVLLLNFVFTVIALALLFHQDWFQCRKWDSNDVSNVIVIGDNYEAQTLFLVTGFQYVISAMAYNFGYEFRQSWIRNYIFVALSTGFAVMHLYVTMVPGKLSCLWRVNCENVNVVNGVTMRDLLPIQNPFNTTVMPLDYRWKLFGIMIANMIAIMGYDYFVVNGIRQRVAAKRLAAAEAKRKAGVVAEVEMELEQEQEQV